MSCSVGILTRTKTTEERKQHYYSMPYWLMKIFLGDFANISFLKLMLLYRKKMAYVVAPVNGKMKCVFVIKCFFP